MFAPFCFEIHFRFWLYQSTRFWAKRITILYQAKTLFTASFMSLRLFTVGNTRLSSLLGRELLIGSSWKASRIRQLNNRSNTQGYLLLDFKKIDCLRRFVLIHNPPGLFQFVKKRKSLSFSYEIRPLHIAINQIGKLIFLRHITVGWIPPKALEWV